MMLALIILIWIAIISSSLAIILYCIRLIWACILSFIEWKARRELERITPSNEELLKMVEKDPPWLEEWLNEDIEGLF